MSKIYSLDAVEVFDPNESGLVSNKKGLQTHHCTVCDHEAVVEIEKRFVMWRPLNEMATLFGLALDDLRRHVQARGLNEVRAQNTYALVGEMLAFGMENLAKDPSGVTAEVMVKLLKHVDQREGRMITRIETETRHLTFQAIPPVGGVVDLPKDTPQALLGDGGAVIPGVLPATAAVTDLPEAEKDTTK